MKVLYDLQAFQWTRYSGIPRYFTELISEFNTMDDVYVQLPCTYCMNRGYQNLFPDKRKSLLWKMIDLMIDKSDRLNPACYLSIVEKKSLEYINGGDYDVFHPTFFSPYYLKHIQKKPYVLTIHDLSLEIYPELVSLSFAGATTLDTELVLEKASRFIADSEYTKKHFTEYYDIDSDLVDVVYLGPTFDRVSLTTNDSNVSQYLLYVNLRSGRKNFYSFVAAIKNILKDNNLQLICSGGGCFTQEENVFFKAHGISELVKYVPADDKKLYSLYQNALAFVFPSIYEGFGLPILEAFACGCPVILSDASCHPEVGGDAAVYFNPKDVVSMRNAVERVVSDEKLRNQMREKGYKQLDKFSWRKCAEETRKVYEKAME